MTQAPTSSWLNAVIRGVGLALLIAPPAIGAPFCVRTQVVPPQCIYFDAAECNNRAREMGGWCSANQSELPVSIALGHYCLITSGRASACIYLDLGSCDVEARHQQGVCVPAPNRPESPAADPYRDIRPSMAGH
jgi:hypothetical protein